MKANIFSALALIALSLSSCKKVIISGKGDVITQDRTVSNFSRVSIEGSTDVTILQGSIFRVTISDYENLVNKVETSVRGDELRIGYQSGVWVTKGKSKAFITVPSLSGVRVNGSGNFIIEGPFTGTDLFSAEINGSGNITVNNMQAKEADIHISGSGDIKAFGLTVAKATVKVAGSGNTEITVNNQLDARINGSGDVYYKGNAVVNSSIHGSGKVIKR